VKQFEIIVSLIFDVCFYVFASLVHEINIVHCIVIHCRCWRVGQKYNCQTDEV